MEWGLKAASKLSTSAHISNNPTFHQVFQLLHRFLSSLNKSHNATSICTFKICKEMCFVLINVCFFFILSYFLQYMIQTWDNSCAACIFHYFSSPLGEKIQFLYFGELYWSDTRSLKSSHTSWTSVLSTKRQISTWSHFSPFLRI